MRRLILTLWALNQQPQDPEIYKKGNFCAQNHGGRNLGPAGLLP